MPAGNTYESIATQTLGSAASSLTFSSIPSTYTDLVLVAATANSSGLNDGRFRINGDTGSNYSRTYLYGSGSAASSGRGSNETYWYNGGYFGTGQSVVIVQFMNYSNTTTYKTALTRSSDAGNNTEALSGLWRSTSAINSIEYSMAAGNFIAGSTFSLYGIKAA